VTALLYQTDASRLVEYTQVNERMPLKELGKLAPYFGRRGACDAG